MSKIMVTSNYHVYRALRYCRRYGISVTEDNCIGYIKKGDELIGL